MKKILSIMALAAIMTSCNSGSDADNAADSAKNKIDSVAGEKKDKIDSVADAQKTKIDSLTEKKDSVNNKNEKKEKK